MVTDIYTNYTSPAGKEFTITAGRLAGINPASRVLDMGCGYGDGACNLAEAFRCKITAVDISAENLEFARQQAVERKISHLITFVEQDLLSADYSAEPFDLILAEGGVLSFLGRRRGLDMVRHWLIERGWLAFSDLTFYPGKVPEEVRHIFEDEKYAYESEESYRKLLEASGFEVQFVCMVPPSGWDNYYAHMARRLEDAKGFFADKDIKRAFHREIDVFYRLEGFRYVGYLFCVARKADENRSIK